MTSYRLSARARRDAIEQAIARGLTRTQIRTQLDATDEQITDAYSRIQRAHENTRDVILNRTPKPPLDEACGTPTGYNRHRSHQEQPCTACAHAHALWEMNKRNWKAKRDEGCAA